MKHFVLLIVTLVICLFCLQDLHVFSYTKDGHRFEYFQTESSNAIPPILANYLRNAKINYSVYKIPNYVKEFLTYDKEFNVIYKSGTKSSIIIFTPRDYVLSNENAFKPFYNQVKKLISNEYPNSFNLIVKEEIAKPKYPLRVDRVAYNDLKSFCGSFCVINPKNDTMFVFKRITNSEIDALEVLLQQYHFLRK